MTREQFYVVLFIISEGVITQIAERRRLTHEQASKMFFNSIVYAHLEVEETKTWHYSKYLLADLFEDELNGTLVWSEVSL